jgi:hypothetical protein
LNRRRKQNTCQPSQTSPEALQQQIGEYPELSTAHMCYIFVFIAGTYYISVGFFTLMLNGKAIINMGSAAINILQNILFSYNQTNISNSAFTEPSAGSIWHGTCIKRGLFTEMYTCMPELPAGFFIRGNDNERY